MSVIFLNKCGFPKARAEEYFDGALSQADSARFLAHLAGCDGCAARLLDVMQLELLADVVAAEERETRRRVVPSKRLCVSGPVGGMALPAVTGTELEAVAQN